MYEIGKSQDDVIIEINPVANVDELIERYGFHPAQIVSSADGKEAYSITEVIREAWFRGSRVKQEPNRVG